MIGRLLQNLYNKIFINILFDGKNSNVYIELCSSGKDLKVLNSAYSHFEGEGISTKMLEFIEGYTSETPYYYISILDPSRKQGALPTCDYSKLSVFDEMAECEHRCVGQKWSYYTQKSDIKSLQNRYQKIGLDFIFSPFTILTHIFKDKVATTFAMYILVQTGELTLGVFGDGKLLFAKHLNTEMNSEESELINSYLEEEKISDGLEGGIDLEEIDVDSEELELIDDFGDIEDLDSLEELDEFSQQQDINMVIDEPSPKKSTPSPLNKSFNQEYIRFKIVHSAIAEYYKDKRYESRFIENIYVADGVSMSVEFKRYLEEELFVNVYARKVETIVELCELAKMELKS